MKVNAVFFDAGDTLLSPHPSFHELFSRVLVERGWAVTPDEVGSVMERMAPSFVEVMDRLASGSWSTSREASIEFWGRLYALALADLGVPDPGGEMAAALYSRFTRYESYRLFPDALPALLALKEAGLLIGLISNFEDWLEGMLIEMEVAGLFDLMVISGKEGMEKPDPAIFRLALERSGVQAHRAMYVGDHPRIDVRGAQAVGMSAVLVDRRGRYPEFAGDKVSTLAQLLPLVVD